MESSLHRFRRFRAAIALVLCACASSPASTNPSPSLDPDRAVQLRTDVGAIRVRLDDRLLQHDNAPGAGDRWNIGDVLATPRLVAKVDVGAIRLDLKTSGPKSP